jgi:hypothetical protein
MRAAKIDANQPAIVAALRKAGATVQSLASVGNGVPDLLVGMAGKTMLMEVKDGAKPPSARRLTPDQLEWHAVWQGGALTVVDSPEAALRALGVLKA